MHNLTQEFKKLQESGLSKGKRIDQFFCLQYTKSWLLQNGGKEKHMKTLKGKNGGTMASTDLLNLFIRWATNNLNDGYIRFEHKFEKLYNDLFGNYLPLEKQKQILNYKLDFYIPTLNLVI